MRKVIFPIKGKYRFTNGGTYQDHLKDPFRKGYAGEDYRPVGRPTIGCPFYAPEDGKIKTGTETVVVEGKSYKGLYIILTSTDGKVVHNSAHFSEVLVKSGQVVKAGDLIAKLGASGYTMPRDPKTGGPSELGAHVHIATLVENKNIPFSSYVENPDAYVKPKGFKKGDNVLVKIKTKVRAGNGLTYKVLGVAAVGAVGRIVRTESRKGDGYTWYDVNFHNKQGWMIDNFLEKTYFKQTKLDGSPIVKPVPKPKEPPKVELPPVIPPPVNNTTPDTGTNSTGTEPAEAIEWNFEYGDILSGGSIIKRKLNLPSEVMGKISDIAMELARDYKSRKFLMTLLFVGGLAYAVYEGIEIPTPYLIAGAVVASVWITGEFILDSRSTDRK